MTSKITGGGTELLFTARLLSKYDVHYYRCRETGFIQTEEPYWLEEAYSSAITKLDVGMVMRNQNLAATAVPLLLRYFNHREKFLDYAGGYGLFTRMMRDKGFDFYHTDPYCQNIFAEFQDLKYAPAGSRFEVVTAFEVLEHLVHPKQDIQQVLSYGKNMFFTTELIPPDLKKDWWYFSFETGQHISFYTEASLRYLANSYGMHYYTDGKWLHLFTADPLKENPFASLQKNRRENVFMKAMRRFLRWYDRRKNALPYKQSLLGYDTENAKKRISS